MPTKICQKKQTNKPLESPPPFLQTNAPLRSRNKLHPYRQRNQIEKRLSSWIKIFQKLRKNGRRWISFQWRLWGIFFRGGPWSMPVFCKRLLTRIKKLPGFSEIIINFGLLLRVFLLLKKWILCYMVLLILVSLWEMV